MRRPTGFNNNKNKKIPAGKISAGKYLPSGQSKRAIRAGQSEQDNPSGQSGRAIRAGQSERDNPGGQPEQGNPGETIRAGNNNIEPLKI